MRRRRKNLHRRSRLIAELLEDRRLLTAVQEVEPNDSIGEANEISVQESSAVAGLLRGNVLGAITPGESDFFSFTAVAGDQVSVSVDPSDSDLDPEVVLRDSAGGRMLQDRDSGPGQGSLTRTIEIESSGRYYIEVLGDNATTEGDYVLGLITSRDHHLESDPDYRNDSVRNAESVAFAVFGTTFASSAAGTVMASEGSDTDEDLYALGLLNAGTDVSLETRLPEWSSVSPVVELVDEDGNQLGDSDPADDAFSGSIVADGQYYARVSASAGAGPDAQYVLDIAVVDAVAPAVADVSRLPADGGTTANLFSTFEIGFSEALDPDTVTGEAFDLRAAGDDGSFGTSDDAVYALSADYAAGSLELLLEITDGPLPDGEYRLTVGPSVTDVVGNALGGGAGYAHDFTVDAIGDEFVFEGSSNDTIETATPLPLVSDSSGTGLLRSERDGRGVIDPADDIDYFTFTAEAGDVAAIHVTPFESHRLHVFLYGPDGSAITSDTSSGPDVAPFISGVELTEAGDYFIGIQRWFGSSGDYRVRVDLSRGVGMETDGNNSNDRINGADAVELAPSGSGQNGSIAGAIMADDGSDTDEDHYALGLLNAGTDVSLEARLPEWSSLSPVVELVDEEGNPLGDSDSADAAFSGSIVADGQYYARVSASAGAGLDAQYVLDIAVVDAVAPAVADVSRLPADGGTTANLFSTFEIGFSEALDPDTVTGEAFDLRAAGADGSFGTADDAVYSLSVEYEAGNLELPVEVADGPLPDGEYRLTVGPSVTDVVGNALGDGAGYAHDFTVDAIGDEFVFEGSSNDTIETATPLPLVSDSSGTGLLRSERDGRGVIDPADDVDYFTFAAEASDRAAVHVTRIDSGPFRVVLYGPDGSQIASDISSGPDGASFLSGVELAEAGDYSVGIHRWGFVPDGSTDDYRVHVDLSRGVGMETDGNNSNDRINSADAVELAPSGSGQSGSIAGAIMADSGSDTDEDHYALGLLNAGMDVSLEARLPEWSSLSPVVELVDEDGNPLGDSDPADDVYSGSIVADGQYYARVSASAGAGLDAQYVLDVTVADTVAPAVADVSRLPADGGTTANLFSTFEIGFSEALDPDTVTGEAFDLRAAGDDGSFGTADDAVYSLSLEYAAGNLELPVEVADGPLPDGEYRLTVVASVTDVVGNALGDGAGYTHHFTVEAIGEEFVFEGSSNDTIQTATPLPLVSDSSGTELLRTARDGRGVIDPADDIDYFTFTAEAGDVAAIHVTDVESGALRATLYGPDGSQIASDFTSGPDGAPFLSGVELAEAGDYSVGIRRLWGSSGDDNYRVHVDLSRGVGMETDGGYTNDWISSADAVELTPSGSGQNGSVAGSIMADQGSNTDEDHYALGLLNAGTTVSLETRLPEWSSLSPVVELVDEDGNPLGDSDPADDAFSGSIVADGQYYARVSASAGAGADAQYVLDIAVADAVAPAVAEVSRLPPDGGTTASLFSTFEIAFSEPLAPNSVTGSAFDLRSAGADGSFGTPDDAVYTLAVDYAAGSFELPVEITDGPLPDGLYRLSVDSSVTDLVGNALGDGAGYTHDFTVEAIGEEFVFEGSSNDTLQTATSLALAADPSGTGLLRSARDGRGVIDPADDVDHFTFTAAAGDVAAIHVTDVESGALRATLYGPDGSQIASDFTSGPDGAPFLSGVELAEAGDYSVGIRRLWGSSGDDNYRVHVDLSRGVGMETDGGFANDAVPGADAVEITSSGNVRNGSIAGSIMHVGSGNVDEDYYDLGEVEAGETILARVQLPQWSTLEPVVELRDSDGQLVSVNPVPSSADVARFTVEEAGRFYAVVLGLEGEGINGQYRLDVTVSDELTLPDLAVARIELPSAPTAGEELTISWTVGNYGTVATDTDTWLDRVVLSKNGTINDTDDLVLGSTVHTGQLAPGETYDASVTATLPERLSGEYYVFVETDSRNEIFEYILDDNNVGEADSRLNINPAPLPDLVVDPSSVVAPENIDPATPFTVRWTVRNAGVEPASGRWEERVFLADGPDGARRQLLGTFVRDENLAAGASSGERTELLTLPNGSFAGDVYFVVEVDATDAVIEGDEANRFVSSVASAVPQQLSVFLGRDSLTEGESPLRMTVTRNGHAGNPLTVDVSADPASQLEFPQQVVIPAWRSSATFLLDARQDGIVDGDVDTAVTASAEDFLAATSSITVVDADDPKLSTTIDSSALAEGATATLTILHNGLADEALVVRLAASRSAQLDLPSSVTIPAGESSIDVPITVVEDGVFEPQMTVHVEAKASGYASSRSAVVINQSDVPTIHVTVPETVAEGGAQAFGTAFLDEPLEEDLFIALASSDPSSLFVLPTAMIRAGSLSTQFSLLGVDNDQVDGEQTIEIVARALPGTAAAPIDSSAVSDSVVLLDNDGPTIRLGIDRDVISETGAATLTVTRNTPPDAPLTVALTSSDTSELTLPATVQIPAGSQTVEVPIAGLEDDVVDGDQPVVITAAAEGFNRGSASILVSDQDLPDLSVRTASFAATSGTGERLEVAWTTINTGLAPVMTGWTERVYLSDDPTPGSDELLGEYRFSGPLDIDAPYQRAVPIRMPEVPGAYWLVFEVDVNDDVREGLESNNFFVSATPVFVEPPYTATVEADVDVVPAGTPVRLTGTARNTDGSAASRADVAITVAVQGTTRVLQTRTDADGDFEAVFTPLPGEGGRYSVAASHPGVEVGEFQDSFQMLGLQPYRGRDFITLAADGSTTQQIAVRNLADVELTGLTVEARDVGDGLSVVARVVEGADAVGSLGRFSVEYDLSHSGPTVGERGFTLRIATTEAPDLEIPITVDVLAPAASLVAGAEPLETTMVVGEQTSVEFVIENHGGGDSGPVEVRLPAGVDWMTVASGRQIPNIPVGESVSVTLLLTPGLDLDLTRYHGRLIVSGETSHTAVPFSFRAVAETTGDLRVAVVDELFYFSEEQPHVEEAEVVVRDPATQEIIATNGAPDSPGEGETASSVSVDAQGRITFSGLPRGRYLLEVSADQHDATTVLVEVAAGGQSDEQVFISRNFVEYTWNVEEVEVEDRTRITVDAEFSTNVPAPVVVVESNIDLSGLNNAGDRATFDVTYTNHGFVQAEDVELFFDEHPLYEIVPLVDSIPVLPAQSTVTIPVVIVRRERPLPSPSLGEGEFASNSEAFPCSIHAYTTYRYDCGPFGVFKRVPIPVVNVDVTCGIAPPLSGGGGGGGGRNANPGAPGGGGGGGFGGGLGGGRGSGGTPRPTISSDVMPHIRPDDPCEECKPFGFEIEISRGGLFESLLDSAASRIKAFPLVKNVGVDVSGQMSIERCCEDGSPAGWGVEAAASMGLTVEMEYGGSKTLGEIDDAFEHGEYEVDIESLSFFAGLRGELKFSGEGSLGKECKSADFQWCYSVGGSLSLRAGIEGSAELEFESPRHDDVKVTGLVTAELRTELSVTAEGCSDEEGQLCVAWSGLELVGEIAYELPNGDSGRAAISIPIIEGFDCDDEDAEAPAGSEGEAGAAPAPDIEATVVEPPLVSVVDFAAGAGFPSAQSFLDAVGLPPDTEELSFEQSLLASNRIARSEQPQVGVCAAVKIRIEQDVVQSRTAFRAGLEIANEVDDVDLEELRTGVRVYDAEGNDVSDRFGVTVQTLQGTTDISGAGAIPAGETASVVWLIVPSADAAPETATEYFLGGDLSYSLDGQEMAVEFVPVSITVRPQAELDLNYFLQRDVIGDDPFTDEVEESEVFSLAVQVINRGAGAARDLRIESAQPKIIENEKGLLVDFEIVGTSVNGEPGERTLTANFGDLDGGELAVAEWYLESTLQGLFTDYEASFEHLSDFGRPGLSLVKSVGIREMIRSVDAVASGVDDELPDFLVNDVPDPLHAPDTIYLSDGTVVDVTLGADPVYDSPATIRDLTVAVSATMETGWSYLRLDDPSGGALQLVGVRRSDGTLLPSRNFWQTDRTFVELGQRPMYENKVHLLDFDSTGEYRFIYSNGDREGPRVEQISGVRPNPTSSAVDHLTVRFDEQIDTATFDVADIELLKNGASVAVEELAILGGASSTYRISGLGASTTDDAVYELLVHLDGISDLVGNVGEGTASFTWVKGEAAPAVIELLEIPEGRVTSVPDAFQVRLTEPIEIDSLKDAAALMLDGTDLLDDTVTVAEIESGLYEIGNLASRMTADGRYEFSIDSSLLRDLDGTPGIGGKSAEWVLDTTGPQIDSVVEPATNPRNIVVQRVDVEFDEPIDVSTFSVADISLTRDGGTANLLADDGRVTIEDRGDNIYRIGGISWVQGFIADPQIATFTLAVDGAGIQDLAGNAGVGTASTSWTIDLDSPQPPENLVLRQEAVSGADGDANRPNAVFSAKVFEPDLTLVIVDDFTGGEIYRGPVSDLEFSLPLRLPSEGRNELHGRLIDPAGNTTDFELPEAFVTSLPPVIIETSGLPSAFRRTPLGSLTFTFAKPVDAETVVEGVVSLYRDQSEISLSEAVEVTAAGDGRTFTIAGLQQATAEEGDYRLSIDLSRIRGTDGTAGQETYSFEWVHDATPPVTQVVARRLGSAGSRYFVSVDAEDEGGGSATSAIETVTVFVASANEPLRRFRDLDPATPATEFEGSEGENYAFFATSSDRAGNLQPLRLTAGDGVSINVDSTNQAGFPDHLVVDEGITVRFTGDWIVQKPELIDGVMTHRIETNGRVLQVETPTPWQNPVLLQDVDRSGSIFPLDALLVINQLNRSGFGIGNPPQLPTDIDDHQYYDVSGDGRISPLDALLVINHINRQQVFSPQAGEGEPPIGLGAVGSVDEAGFAAPEIPRVALSTEPPTNVVDSARRRVVEEVPRATAIGLGKTTFAGARPVPAAGEVDTLMAEGEAYAAGDLLDHEIELLSAGRVVPRPW